jgi:hypothetical protein
MLFSTFCYQILNEGLKTGWQELTAGLFSGFWCFCCLFEPNGQSTKCFKELGTGRLQLARKATKDSLAAAWLNGLQPAYHHG